VKEKIDTSYNLEAFLGNVDPTAQNWIYQMQY